MDGTLTPEMTDALKNLQEKVALVRLAGPREMADLAREFRRFGQTMSEQWEAIPLIGATSPDPEVQKGLEMLKQELESGAPLSDQELHDYWDALERFEATAEKVLHGSADA